jgi:hypothetical protein
MVRAIPQIAAAGSTNHVGGMNHVGTGAVARPVEQRSTLHHQEPILKIIR